MRTALFALALAIWLNMPASSPAQETIRMIGTAADKGVVISKLPFEEEDGSVIERTYYRGFGGGFYGYRPYRYNYRAYNYYRPWRGGYGGGGYGMGFASFGGMPYYGFGGGSGWGGYGWGSFGYNNVNPAFSVSYYGRPGVGFYYGNWPN